MDKTSIAYRLVQRGLVNLPTGDETFGLIKVRNLLNSGTGLCLDGSMFDTATEFG